MTRRDFLKSTTLGGLAIGLPKLGTNAGAQSQPAGAHETIRVAVVGLGDTKAIGGVGGRGHQLIPRIREVPGVKIVALCDADQRFLEREAQPFKDRGEAVATHSDLRRVLDDNSVDAVVIALPNHWHALATIWACQAGKDVYVEKPFSHNLWEGRQMVAAARKYGRIVQIGTQNRSSPLLPQVFADLRRGELGPIRYAHALVYRPRDGIGKVSAPTPVPASVDYDLWCGPAPKGPLLRRQLHYEWHWFWDTGNGEMGNNGPHVIDLCRWALGQQQPPPRALSIGGRFAFDDCGQTANTHIALFDYQPAPLICEIRNVTKAQPKGAIGSFRNTDHGILIDCEGGYFAGDAGGGAFYDRQQKKIKDLPDDGSSKTLETAHLANFFAAVRSRNRNDLAAEALQGHLSTSCCHLANISHRLGQQSSPEAIGNTIQASRELSDAFERCYEYLRDNDVDLHATPATLGPWVTFDAKQERFTGSFSDSANALAHREYRKPFVVPGIA
jgi:predicted dehydrogenase